MDNKWSRLWISLISIYKILKTANAQIFAPMQHPMPLPVYPAPMLAAPAPAIPASTIQPTLEAFAIPVPVPAPVPMPIPVLPNPPPPIFCQNREEKKKNDVKCPPCPPCLCTPSCTPQFFSYCSPCHQKCRCQKKKDTPKPLPPFLIAPSYIPLPPVPPIVMVPIIESNSDQREDKTCDSSSTEFSDDSDSSSESRFRKRKSKKRKRRKNIKFKYARKGKKRQRSNKHKN